jgi:hypothetical protein
MGSEEEKARAEDALAKAKPYLNGEKVADTPTIIIDNKLLPAQWKEIVGEKHLPMREVIEFLYTDSFVDEVTKSIMIHSTSSQDLKLKSQSFPTSLSPIDVLRGHSYKDGYIAAASTESTTDVTLLELAMGDEYLMPIENLQKAFGWEFFEDRTGNLLVIVTDGSNLSEEFIVKPTDK